MIKETIPELQKLSTADKFALAVELWDELSSNPDEIPVTEEQLNELDRRFEEYRQDPDKVVTWEPHGRGLRLHRRGLPAPEVICGGGEIRMEIRPDRWIGEKVFRVLGREIRCRRIRESDCSIFQYKK